MISKYGVAIMLVLLAATPLRATTRATDYPGSVSMLLCVESVRSDLALDAKQKSRLNALRKELRSKSEVLTRKKSKVPISRLTPDQKLFFAYRRQQLQCPRRAHPRAIRPLPRDSKSSSGFHDAGLAQGSKTARAGC